MDVYNVAGFEWITEPDENLKNLQREIESLAKGGAQWGGSQVSTTGRLDDGTPAYTAAVVFPNNDDMSWVAVVNIYKDKETETIAAKGICHVLLSR